MILYEPKDTVKTIRLEDRRELNPATGKPFKKKGEKSINAPEANVRAIIAQAKAQNIDPYNALAIAMQESNLGQTDMNFGHVKGVYTEDAITDRTSGMSEADAMAYIMTTAIKDKLTYADQLVKKGKIPNQEEYLLQAYNGLGKLYPQTEKEYHGGESAAFYGIPVTKDNPLDLSKNPAYGKTVLSLRDQILKSNPDLQKLVQDTPAYTRAKTRKYGGYRRK